MSTKSISDLPDEILLRIVAWVSYRPGSHGVFPSVCRRFQSVMETKSLPGMIAWYQFAPFMRTLEGYRGRSLSNYRQDELLQTWKSITMHRDWMAFLQSTTRLKSDDCLVIASIFHFLAAARKQTMLGRRRSLGSFFLAKALHLLPAPIIMLLRYVSIITLDDIHDRHAPFDLCQHLCSRPLAHESVSDAQRFALKCILDSTCLTLDDYRPFYNIMADRVMYDDRMKLDSRAANSALESLKNQEHSEIATIDPSALAAFAFHVRLIRIGRQSGELPSASTVLEDQINATERLSCEYSRMINIKNDVLKLFSSCSYRLHFIRALDLEEYGATLRSVAREVEAVDGGQGSSMYMDWMRDTYDLRCWPK